MKLGKKRNREKRKKFIELMTGDDGISFYLLNEYVIKLLEDELNLPLKDIDEDADRAWNKKRLVSKLLRGLLNGDSIDDIALSILGIVNNDKSSALRIARTMITEAENAGRLESYRDLDEQGVVQKKTWIATPDSRTRPTHLAIDGEEQDIEKPFSNDLMYPGDPRGKPSEVYNCRCTMTDYIIGFRRKDGSISYVGGRPETTTHEPQIEEERAKRQAEKEERERRRR